MASIVLGYVCCSQAIRVDEDANPKIDRNVVSN